MNRARLALLTFFISLIVFAFATVHTVQASGPQQDVIVVFHPNVNAQAAVPDFARAHGLAVAHTYSHALQGVSGSMPEGRINALRNDPRVAYVELDQVVSIDQQLPPNGLYRIFPDTTALDMDSSDDYRVDVDVAVIDTGIDFEHPELNVVGGVDCVDGTCAPGGDDDQYHGTHVAGTIGALDNNEGVLGVAPGARLWAVKVLDSTGNGSFSGVIAGIDWVTANADTIEVANLSLGCKCTSQAMDDALTNAVQSGVVVVVSAGNDSADAKDYSPANHPDVITVSALADYDGEAGGNGSYTCYVDQDDTLANFSNYGSVVDVIAPGTCISSTYPGNTYRQLSGTSMAAPHVAGAAALLASGANDPVSKADVDAIANTIINAGNFDWTGDANDGHKEPLLDISTFTATLIPTDGSTPSNTAPSVSIGSPTDGATFESGTAISFSGSASDAEDGNLTASLTWSSNLDGQIGTGGSFSTTLSDGTHTVTATVTDSNGATTSRTVTITVETPPTEEPSAITLTGWGYKEKGRKIAELSWSGATTAQVDIYRDGVLIATVDNTGSFTDFTGQRGGGGFTYQVCEAGATTCSAAIIIDF